MVPYGVKTIWFQMRDPHKQSIPAAWTPHENHTASRHVVSGEATPEAPKRLGVWDHKVAQPFGVARNAREEARLTGSRKNHMVARLPAAVSSAGQPQRSEAAPYGGSTIWWEYHMVEVPYDKLTIRCGYHVVHVPWDPATIWCFRQVESHHVESAPRDSGAEGRRVTPAVTSPGRRVAARRQKILPETSGTLCIARCSRSESRPCAASRIWLGAHGSSRPVWFRVARLGRREARHRRHPKSSGRVARRLLESALLSHHSGNAGAPPIRRGGGFCTLLHRTSAPVCARVGVWPAFRPARLD